MEYIKREGIIYISSAINNGGVHLKNIRFGTMLIAASVLLTVLCGGCAKGKGSAEAESTVEIDEGRIAVTVVDKKTQKPIAEARIIIAGSENIYKTDSKGKSPEITLKVNKDRYKRYREELYRKAPSGTVTVLVTKEGYKDYVVFNMSVYPGYAANTLEVGMVKGNDGDRTGYVKEYGKPDEIWTEDLISYCAKMKDEKPGNGTNRVAVSVKDESGKALKDVSVVIPELNLRVVTDKSGSCRLNPDVLNDQPASLPVLRESSEYTVVASKDGYIPSVMFNVEVEGGKERSLKVVLKEAKPAESDTQSVTFQPYESEWIEKAITTMKQ